MDIRYPSLDAVCFVIACYLHYGNPQSFDCPSDWYAEGDSCYQFFGDSPASYEEATLQCSTHGAGLVSIETRSEHDFISKWLQTNDINLRDWYTSGERESTSSRANNFVWKGTGDVIAGFDQFWQEGSHLNVSRGVVIYRYFDMGYRWSVIDTSVKLPFICEIPKTEAYRILQDFRDFDYGLQNYDSNSLERGPHFILQPESTVIVGDPTEVSLECVVMGNPQPTYTWWKGDNYQQQLTSDQDKRYTLTNGKLIIANPKESLDSGNYRCKAENRYGVIIGNGVQLSFGDIGEFSNVPDAPVNAKAYEGAAIDCSKITFKPAVKYNWYKKSAEQFVRPEYQKYMFMSQNGKLYFSEVTQADDGRYFCIAVLTGINQHTIGTSQPPARTSLPISLYVHNQAPKADWGPVIQNEFIAVFPTPPLVGRDVRLECFAYGSSTSDFQYLWRRLDKPLPSTAILSDHNRVLTIQAAKFKDQGLYTCIVSRSSSAMDEKSADLKLGARPYFPKPIQDQHADIGSALTLRCDARANPTPTYWWYKNGQLLQANEPLIRVNRNILVIMKLDPQLHNGMYQCAASNIHGTTVSEGQLRVLVITWYKNGVELTNSLSNMNQSPNGVLTLTNINKEDEGTYICRAVNSFGEAEDRTTVKVIDGTAISALPQDQTAMFNTTIFLSCLASFAKGADLIYTWLFNGHLINHSRSSEFRHVQDEKSGQTGLYIQHVNFYHTGYYECQATTTVNSDKRGAYLNVVGPPAEPAGVLADTTTVTNSSVLVRWTDNTDNGRPIINYIVEAANAYDKDAWQVVIGNLPAILTIHTVELKRFVVVTGLLPGCGYRFRLKAVNQLGKSPPSLPSGYIQTRSAAPTVAPTCIGGGGGKVGNLMMTWQPLSLVQQAGPGIGYRLYWKQHDNVKDEPWSVQDVSDVDHYITLVGVDNYFLPYDFKIQAFNDFGMGPNSTEVVIMSGEDLPAAVPTNVIAEDYNGTALEVSWTPVPPTRELARGKILGYQINYWHHSEVATDYREFIRHYGQIDSGIVVGLRSEEFYYVTVQAYNSAGIGPISEYYFVETSLAPASQYPEEIRVYSAGRHHGRYMVEVWWRGIHISQIEGNVHGFVIYYWHANEDYTAACRHVVHDHHAHHTHIEVDPGVVYALRVSAYSEGGYGKKSLTTYFTLEGDNVLVDYNLAQTVEAFLASAQTPPTSVIHILILLIMCRYVMS